RSVDEQRDEKQRDAHHHRSDDDTDGTDATGRKAQPKAQAAASALRDPANQKRGERRSQREQCRWQARQAVRAKHVLRNERANGDAGGETCPSEHLASYNDFESALLNATPQLLEVRHASQTIEPCG